MDVCNLDWGAIATFTGAGVACFIFYQWKNQKSSEVIANEAKELIYCLNECTNLSRHIENKYKTKSSHIENLELKYCDKVIDIEYKLETFHNLINAKYNKIDSTLKSLIESYKRADREFNDSVRESSPLDNVNDKLRESIDKNNKLKLYISLYALYKK